MNVIEKDILTVEEGIICHAANCVRVMGAGLARQIAKKWPDCYRDFKEHEPLLGNLHLYRVEPNVVVCHLFTQQRVGRDMRHTNYDALESALLNLQMITFNSTFHVYFPYLMCCGLGGGDWKIVEPMLDQYFPNATICKLPTSPNLDSV